MKDLLTNDLLQIASDENIKKLKEKTKSILRKANKSRGKIDFDKIQEIQK